MGRKGQAQIVEHYSTYFDSLEKLTIIKNYEVQKRQDLSVNHKPEKNTLPSWSRRKTPLHGSC